MNSHLPCTTNSGYLELFIGPMFSGKTSKILELYKQLKFCNITVLVINYAEDKRYHSENLSTHDKIMIPCVSDLLLHNIIENRDINIDEYDTILINEGQFFPDLFDCVKTLVDEKKKNVYICGLDGDFKREKFGSLLDLIPICDNVTKLTSLCVNCKNGTKAIFTHRISNESEQKVIGSSNYIPLCRKCYFEKQS